MGPGDIAQEGDEAGPGAWDRAAGHLLVLLVPQALAEPWARADLKLVYFFFLSPCEEILFLLFLIFGPWFCYFIRFLYLIVREFLCAACVSINNRQVLIRKSS